MKKTLLFTGLFLTILSCSNDNNDNGIEGEWTSTSIRLIQGFDFDGDGTPGNEVKEELPCLNHSFNLNSNGTGQYTSNLAGVAPQPSLTLYACFWETTNEIKWTLSNDTISVIYADSDANFQINVLDNNTLERVLLGLNDEEEGRIIFKK